MREIQFSSDLINNPVPKKSKYDFGWEIVEVGQSFFVKYNEVKDIKVLRVIASQKGNKLGKEFKVVDNKEKQCYEVGLTKIHDKVYYLLVPAVGEFESGMFKSRDIKKYNEKCNNYLESYRKQYNIPKEIELRFDWPWMKSKKSWYIEVTLEEIKKYQQPVENNVVNEQQQVIEVKKTKFF